MKKLLLIVFSVYLLVEPLKVLYHPEPCPTPPPQYVLRQRCMEIREIFLDGNGNPKNLQGIQLELNFFANDTYIGTVQDNGWDAGNYYWIGTFDGIEYSYFTIMYVAETFIINAAMPGGVWEVKSTGYKSIYNNDLYRVTEMELYNE